MIIKFYWEKCHEFVVEEEDAFFIEATADEALGKIYPLLSPQEKLKFEQMKEVYVAKATTGGAHEDRYYFLVSRGARLIKFESVALLTSDPSLRGGKVSILPDIRLSSIDELDSVEIGKS